MKRHSLFIFYIIYGTLLSTPLRADEARLKCEATLFTTREPTEFQSTLKTAEKIGIHKQIILEAKFLYYVDTSDYESIAALNTEFESHLKNFDLNESKIFTTREQWQSVIQYSLALQALESKNERTFKKHITEAFWLSPETASAFSHHITGLRNRQIMEKIIITPDRELLTLDTKKTITFKELIENNDAIILRFWSPWNQGIDTTYPLLESAARQCVGKKITFASVILEADQQLIDAAKTVQSDQEPALQSLWLIDSQEHSFSKQLRISNLPTLVIITKEGRISYHGQASDDKFWNILSKINPEIKQP